MSGELPASTTSATPFDIVLHSPFLIPVVCQPLPPLPAPVPKLLFLLLEITSRLEIVWEIVSIVVLISSPTTKPSYSTFSSSLYPYCGWLGNLHIRILSLSTSRDLIPMHFRLVPFVLLCNCCWCCLCLWLIGTGRRFFYSQEHSMSFIDRSRQPTECSSGGRYSTLLLFTSSFRAACGALSLGVERRSFDRKLAFDEMGIYEKCIADPVQFLYFIFSVSLWTI